MACIIILAFSTSLILPPHMVNAQSLPAPGMMVTTSPEFVPPMLTGLIIHSENPFQFDFIFDSGYEKLTKEETKKISLKLIRYFLASLTVPEDDLWVNLSPYEKDRIIPNEFSKTEMGRDMLAQDYLLKQLAASLSYPENELGKEFWDRVYLKAKELYGTTEIPTNTFNKVWIVPDEAHIFENVDRAYIVDAHLKVMVEEDYLVTKENTNSTNVSQKKVSNSVSSQILKDVIIPAIEKEVNEGTHFAQLRQIYHSFILASWYKNNLKKSVLNRSYSDQKKVFGLDIKENFNKNSIYEQYIEAYKKGVYSFIKEDYDAQAQEVIPRKYFSGGIRLKDNRIINNSLKKIKNVGNISEISIVVQQATKDNAQTTVSSKKETDRMEKQVWQEYLGSDEYKKNVKYFKKFEKAAVELGWKPLSPGQISVAHHLLLRKGWSEGLRGVTPELMTGEGKTMAIAMAAYAETQKQSLFNPANNNRVHIVTFNPYLAQVASQEMGPILSRLGVSVGLIEFNKGYAVFSNKVGKLKKTSREEALNAAIVYGAYTDFAGEYLQWQAEEKKEPFPIAEKAFIDEIDAIVADDWDSPVMLTAPLLKKSLNSLQPIIDFEKKIFDALKLFYKKGHCRPN